MHNDLAIHLARATAAEAGRRRIASPSRLPRRPVALTARRRRRWAVPAGAPFVRALRHL